MSFRRHLSLYLGIFLIALSTLVLEIALTRVFCVSLWYQFGFMIISTALLGFGASGSWLAVRRDAFEGDIYAKLTRSTLLYSISVLAAFWVMVHIPLDPLKPLLPGTENPQAATIELILYMGLYYAVIVEPFFFAGLTLGRAFSVWSQDVGRLYFADLIGAGIGSFLVVLALYAFSGQQVVVLASIAAALAALAFSFVVGGEARRVYLLPIAIGVYSVLLIAVILPLADHIFPLYIPPSKPLHIAYDKENFPDVTLEYTGWTPFARIDVMWQPGMKGQAWGLSGAYKGPLSEQKFITIEYYGWTNFGTFRSGKLTLTALLIQALTLAAALIIWPLWRFHRQSLSTRGAKRFLLYFVALGAGFIFIEIGLMQRFILFLGHPTFALSVVLFSLLLFSGLGSYLSGKLTPLDVDPRRVLRWIIPALAVLMLLYIFMLPPVLQWGLGWSTPVRTLFSILLIAPLGLLMGMPFPLGFRLVGEVNDLLAPWAWGVNGFASVVGSILSVMLAQTIGFSQVMALAILIYLIGLAVLLSLRTDAGSPAPASA